MLELSTGNHPLSDAQSDLLNWNWMMTRDRRRAHELSDRLTEREHISLQHDVAFGRAWKLTAPGRAALAEAKMVNGGPAPRAVVS